MPEPVAAIQDVWVWPNLTRLPNGDIVAMIYNQPSHGRMPGDVECWASTDEGETWTKRSVAAPRRAPEQNRMNVAAGLTATGNLILVNSGWSDPGNPDAWAKIGKVLPTWGCISKDNATIVLSYGKRGGEQRGVEVVFSDNGGKTLRKPYRIVALDGTDLGYPSSVQRSDGQIVTAYCDGGSGTKGYYMGVVIWDPEQTRTER